MLKKLFILLIAIAPIATMAQNLQIATVNSQEIFSAMPELPNIERQLTERAQEMEAIRAALEQEHNNRLQEFFALPDTTSETIRQDREREIMQIIERHQTFVENSEMELQQLYFSLLEPIQARISEAIEAVANEGNYSFVFDVASQAAQMTIVFIHSSVVDITPLVRARLGIR